MSDHQAPSSDQTSATGRAQDGKPGAQRLRRRIGRRNGPMIVLGIIVLGLVMLGLMRLTFPEIAYHEIDWSKYGGSSNPGSER